MLFCELQEKFLNIKVNNFGIMKNDFLQTKKTRKKEIKKKKKYQYMCILYICKFSIYVYYQ